jgi:hypothetical protein
LALLIRNPSYSLILRLFRRKIVFKKMILAFFRCLVWAKIIVDRKMIYVWPIMLSNDMGVLARSIRSGRIPSQSGRDPPRTTGSWPTGQDLARMAGIRHKLPDSDHFCLNPYAPNIKYIYYFILILFMLWIKFNYLN